MNTTCGCCEGTEKITPQSTVNRPGLPVISHRVGTHATFLETMKARLSDADVKQLRALRTREASDPAIALLDGWATVADVLAFYQERIANEGFLRTATERRSVVELARLIGYTPRPGVAASVHLAFTLDADHSKSPPAGVETTIPIGTRVQSVPGPGELPQFFETSEPLVARTEWNKLQPRLTRPQTLESIRASTNHPRVFLKGINTQLKVNDPVILETGDPKGPLYYILRVTEALPDPAADRTKVCLRPWDTAPKSKKAVAEVAARFTSIKSFGIARHTKVTRQVVDQLKALGKLTESDDIKAALSQKVLPRLAAASGPGGARSASVDNWLARLSAELEQARQSLAGETEVVAAVATVAKAAATPLSANGVDSGKLFIDLDVRPSRPPSSARRLERESRQAAGSDFYPRLLGAMRPELGLALRPALRHAEVTPSQPIKFHVFRAKASLFGHNVPPQPVFDDGQLVSFTQPNLLNTWGSLIPGTASLSVVALDAANEEIQKDSLVFIDRVMLDDHGRAAGPRMQSLHTVDAVVSTTMAAHGLSTKVTQFTTTPAWLPKSTDIEFRLALQSTDLLRGTALHVQSETLGLAEEPIDKDVCDGVEEPIELDGWYDGMDSGRWLIVSGERTKLAGTSGVQATELVMLAGLNQSFDDKLPGDRPHTHVRLANKLAYCYKRDTVTIYGNVVRATHGETKQETLGSGDGAKPLQNFLLRQPPLTFVSAANPAGIDSTLKVRVNDVQWHETDSLAALDPAERKFVTQTDDDGKTKIVFGTGVHGARPPTGGENIRAEYRSGIGKAGNAKAGQINQLVSRPLGVKEVINPLAASGGADKDTRDQARLLAPLTVQALDRLVSVQDYEDFARTFAGIGKASAVELSDGKRQVVHVTVAGVDDIPIEPDSDLLRNLRKSLRDFGDPLLPVRVEVRSLRLLLISAKVRVARDYEWETLEPKIRAALLEAFGFERRELGQDVTAAEVLAVIQAVRGVAWVDLDLLEGIDEKLVQARIAELLGLDTEKPNDTPKQAETLAPASARAPARCPGERVSADLAERNKNSTEIDDVFLPAGLVYLTPAVPDTLILMEIKS